MDSRWARVARGWTAAGFATLAAAVSHTLAGGIAPSLFGMLVSVVISASVCTVLAGRTLSWWRLAASVALSQLLFHWLFSGLGLPAAIEPHDMSSMAMDAPTHAHPAATMWLAHLAAALLTFVAFRYAESAFWGVADTARLMLARLLAVVIPLFPARATPPAEVERRFVPRDLALLLSSMRHRGPPLESA